MAQIFPQWANKVPGILVSGLLIFGMVVVGFVWYYFSPEYTDVGYRPSQPVKYSHKLHAGDLGIDCRYCHISVEKSPVANIPPTQTCMNCHKIILPESEKLLPVRESWASVESIEWIRVHNLPDYAYFNHALHFRAGVGCISCHGNVAEMEVVTQIEPLSMSWCRTCHRNPDEFLRPVKDVTNMTWVPPSDHSNFVERIIREKNILPPEDCYGCHR